MVLALAGAPAIGDGPAAAAASARATGAPSYQLAGVSCAGASFCMAVGSSALRSSGVDRASRTLAERWNGTKWSIVASPGTAGSALLGVSCPSPTFCIAVGSVVGRWNGRTWAIVATPKIAGAVSSTLDAVSCPSSLGCLAVGGYDTGDGRHPTLVERWNGSKWSILASPNPAVGEGSQLAGVSCPAATSCVAVGWNNIGGPGEPTSLIEHWDGKAFSLVTDPRPRGFSALYGVSCPAVNSCATAGFSQAVLGRFHFAPRRSLVERWNGAKWSTVASPSPGPAGTSLAGVSCASATSCSAVGQSTDTAGRTAATVLRANGATWAAVAVPAPVGATVTEPAGISCATATSCVAVGRSTTSTDPRASDAGPFRTYAARAGGATWSLTATPDPPAPLPVR